MQSSRRGAIPGPTSIQQPLDSQKAPFGPREQSGSQAGPRDPIRKSSEQQRSNRTEPAATGRALYQRPAWHPQGAHALHSAESSPLGSPHQQRLDGKPTSSESAQRRPWPQASIRRCRASSIRAATARAAAGRTPSRARGQCSPQDSASRASALTSALRPSLPTRSLCRFRCPVRVLYAAPHAMPPVSIPLELSPAAFCTSCPTFRDHNCTAQPTRWRRPNYRRTFFGRQFAAHALPGIRSGSDQKLIKWKEAKWPQEVSTRAAGLSPPHAHCRLLAADGLRRFWGGVRAPRSSSRCLPAVSAGTGERFSVPMPRVCPLLCPLMRTPPQGLDIPYWLPVYADGIREPEPLRRGLAVADEEATESAPAHTSAQLTSCMHRAVPFASRLSADHRTPASHRASPHDLLLLLLLLRSCCAPPQAVGGARFH